MINHYTSINNLALILNSGRIRFTRMDQVDDIMEIDGLISGLSKITFISCWTEESEENIALWKMYTPDMQGVRITLPKIPFQQFILKKGTYANHVNVESDTFSYLPIEELIGETFMIWPMFDTTVKNSQKSAAFYKQVLYVDNAKSYYENFQNFNTDTRTWSVTSVFDLGLYKSKIWSFQKESRFTLYCVPLLDSNHPYLAGNSNAKFDFIGNALFENSTFLTKELKYLDHIDVPLDQEFINEMVVTLGPTCGLSERIIVEALLKQYTSKSILKESSLSGQIRMK